VFEEFDCSFRGTHSFEFKKCARVDTQNNGTILLRAVLKFVRTIKKAFWGGSVWGGATNATADVLP